MKLSKRAKISLLSMVLIAAVAVPVFAWIASNTLHFSTTLTGSPFALTILDSFASRNVQIPPYLPSPIYWEQPIVLYTNTHNLANSAYSNVRTNYKIWRTDGGSMDTSWVTVHVKDVVNDFDLTFGLASDTLSINATIGPYTAPALFSVDATVTVTFHTSAPLVEYQADVWVTVG